MHKDIKMLYQLKYIAKSPFKEFRTYPLSMELRAVFRRTCDFWDKHSDRNYKIILDHHAGLKGKKIANKYGLTAPSIRLIVLRHLRLALKRRYWDSNDYVQTAKELKLKILKTERLLDG